MLIKPKSENKFNFLTYKIQHVFKVGSTYNFNTLDILKNIDQYFEQN
jgi:hypothetical protein